MVNSHTNTNWVVQVGEFHSNMFMETLPTRWMFLEEESVHRWRVSHRAVHGKADGGKWQEKTHL